MAQREYWRQLAACFELWKQNRVEGAFSERRAKFVREESVRRNWEVPGREIRLASSPARRSTRIAARRLRRAFDVICAAAGLALLVPLLAMIALVIKLDDGGPILFSHLRIGKGLRKFRLLKFRTMIPASAGGSTVTSPGDTRVTRVGRYLRKYKLDELPQLVNVFRGEMQLVGVRPQMERFVDIFHEQYAELLQDLPGITDLATLSFRNEERFFFQGSIEEQYVKRIMPIKLQLALKYARTRTFFSDLEIILRTVFGMDAPSTAWRSANIDPSVKSLSDYFSRNAS